MRKIILLVAMTILLCGCQAAKNKPEAELTADPAHVVGPFGQLSFTVDDAYFPLGQWPYLTPVKNYQRALVAKSQMTVFAHGNAERFGQILLFDTSQLPDGNIWKTPKGDRRLLFGSYFFEYFGTGFKADFFSMTVQNALQARYGTEVNLDKVYVGQWVRRGDGLYFRIMLIVNPEVLPSEAQTKEGTEQYLREQFAAAVSVVK